jgi:Ca2+/Na+ antiporter
MLGFLAGFFFGLFIFAMNPTSKRPYKHMTPSAIIMLLVMFVVYMFVIVQRVYATDGLMVVLPGFTGVIALLLVPCMKKDEGKGDGEDAGKLV